MSRVAISLVLVLSVAAPASAGAATNPPGRARARATLPSQATLRGTLGGAPWQYDVALHQAEPGAGLAAQ